MLVSSWHVNRQYQPEENYEDQILNNKLATFLYFSAPMHCLVSQAEVCTNVWRSCSTNPSPPPMEHMPEVCRLTPHHWHCILISSTPTPSSSTCSPTGYGRFRCYPSRSCCPRMGWDGFHPLPRYLIYVDGTLCRVKAIQKANKTLTPNRTRPAIGHASWHDPFQVGHYESMARIRWVGPRAIPFISARFGWRPRSDLWLLFYHRNRHKFIECVTSFCFLPANCFYLSMNNAANGWYTTHLMSYCELSAATAARAASLHSIIWFFFLSFFLLTFGTLLEGLERGFVGMPCKGRFIIQIMFLLKVWLTNSVLNYATREGEKRLAV